MRKDTSADEKTMNLTEIIGDKSNYVFLGEAGCGKSELAINLALALAKTGKKPVHFFDLDMTKPLFRSRDVAETLTAGGVTVHFQEQFYDAPTQVGGPGVLLRDDDCYTILDVGGDYMGASAVGGYAMHLRGKTTVVYYMVNPYRPWSMDLAHIDGVLSQVLGAAHLPLSQLQFVGNPNLGVHTTREEIHDGLRHLQETLDGCATVAFGCVWDALWPLETDALPLVPLHLYLTYPWEQKE